MLSITSVDVIKPYLLELTFSDGFSGVADLSDTFKKSAFSQVADFNAFALVHGTLSWGEVDLAVEYLRELTQGKQSDNYPDTNNLDPNIEDDMRQILQGALWQAIEENRPDVLQGAIAMFVEKYGHAKVIKQAGIKSRTSAYRSLRGETSPKLDTLIRLGHAAYELSQQAINVN